MLEYWLVIKNLPSTLPEPRSEIQEPSFGKLNTWILIPEPRCEGLEQILPLQPNSYIIYHIISCLIFEAAFFVF